MLGVGDRPPHPAALGVMIELIKQKVPTVPVFNDVPVTPPNTFITVDRVGGTELAGGHISEPMFVFQCYSPDQQGSEELAELLLSVLKSARFTRLGPVQLRAFQLVGGPQSFPDPKVPSRRRWQFTGTFSMN